MQANNLNEHLLVKICMTELCKTEGFPDYENLVQRDFQFLCESIESKTNVLISLSTIRRLINGQFSRLPQIATLDAIAATAGYQNWQTFKLAKLDTHTQDEVVLKEIHKPGSVNKFMTHPVFFLTCILFVAALCFILIISLSSPNVRNIEKAQFSVAKVTGNDIPNTVVFSYNIDSVIADSFFIQQSWDKNRRTRIFKNSHTLTDIYYEPGYHSAKLIANDKIIKTAPVSIPTDRWFFYAKEGFTEGRPQYIFPDSNFKQGSLQLTKGDLLKSKIDIQKEKIYVNAYFPSDIKSNSDNFVLKFRIKINELNNDLCPFFMAEVLCQQNFMYFSSSPKGCSSELLLQFGENNLTGKNHDFSALGSDVRNWQNVELKVKNKKVNIRINGIDVFSTVYHNSCGLITGLSFVSNGLCEVDFVDFKTLDGAEIYTNDFNL